jgi:hypothetical protein
VLRSNHPNVLVVGPVAATETAIRELRPYLRHPLVKTRVASLGSIRPATSTLALLVEDVGRLTPADQSALLSWVEGAGEKVQLVTTAREPLLPVVTAGRFLESLYYRLNVIYLDLSA